MPGTDPATIARLCRQGLPTAAAAAITAILAPFSAGIAAGLTLLVGASAWAGSVRRRSAFARPPEHFIKS
jgi:hypothetical protein